MSESSSSPEACVVCGGLPNGRRYGPMACLGCIVFFRRAIQDGKLGSCEKQCRYRSFQDLKFICRSCRLQRCLISGMNPDAIKYRDKLGPRKPNLKLVATVFVKADKDLDSLLLIQKKQRNLHKRYCKPKLNMKQKLYRRASAYDINLVLKMGLQNAMEFANQFGSFWNFKVREKKLVLSEFGIAYVLVDQAWKTASMADKGFWLLQNDSFLNPDFFFNISAKDAEVEVDKVHAKHHFQFVSELIKRVSDPFSNLAIDKFECVVLKTLLLLSPSFPGKIKLEDSEKMISKCMSELMAHCVKKSSRIGVERCGEIILLTRAIRCAVKSFYNQTKTSSLFDISKFDPFVKGSFLS